MRNLFIVLVAVFLGACNGSPAAPPSADPVFGTWAASDAGPFATIITDLSPAPNVAGLAGPVYVTLRDCRPGGRVACLQSGYVIDSPSVQAGSAVSIVFTFPGAAFGATFAGEQRADGTLRGRLEVRDGSASEPRHYPVTFYRQ